MNGGETVVFVVDLYVGQREKESFPRNTVPN